MAPGVVDQHVDAGVVGADGLGQTSGPVLGRQIGRRCRCRNRIRRARRTAAATASALREAITTVAPAATNPPAIIRPIPRVPPVTTTVLPGTENSSAGEVGAAASTMGRR